MSGTQVVMTLPTFVAIQNRLLEVYWFWVNYPDVITGWNSRFFDIPYLVNYQGGTW